MKFSKTIKHIEDNPDFFEIDYEDLLNNFDNDNTEEKEKTSMQLSLVNIAFIDSIRGDITRPKFIDRILTNFRREMIEDIKHRMPQDSDDS